MPMQKNNPTQREIISLLRSINSDDIIPIIAYMLNNDFFTSRCGSHHQYKGGNADHALEVYHIAKKLRDKHEAKYKHCRKVSDKSLILCCILHDLCKTSGFKGLNGQPFIGGHGSRSLFIARKHGLVLTEEESAAILCHMGLRNNSRRFAHLYDIAKHSRLCYYVHKADSISASLHHHDHSHHPAA